MISQKPNWTPLGLTCWLLCGSDSKRMSDVQGGCSSGEQRRQEARQVQATLQAAGRDQMKHLPSWNKAALLKIHTHTLVSGQPKDMTLTRSSTTTWTTNWNFPQLKRQHLAWLQRNRRNPSSSLATVRVESCCRLPFAAKGNPVGTLIWFLAQCDVRKQPVGRMRAEKLQVQHKVNYTNQFNGSH